MGRRHTLALVAGAATLLASLPLGSVFDTTTWLVYAVFCVALVVGSAMLVRTLRGPAWAQMLAMMATMLLFVTWAFPSGGEIAAIIPTGATFANFNTLLQQAGVAIRDQAVPVPDLDGLLLLTTAGIGLVAMLVDLAAVGIRRPALAGLPMLAIYSVPVAVLPEGVNPFAFFFGAAGYLWLLVSDSVDRVRRFGRRFSGEGRDVDVWEPSPLSAAGRRLGLVGLVVAILVPLAVPGMTAGFLDRFGTGPGGQGSEGTNGSPAAAVDLTALLQTSLTRRDEFEMVRVHTTETAPYYLRLGIADQATNDGFVSTPLTTDAATVTRPLEPYVAPAAPGVTKAQYKADIEVVNLDTKLAPVYSQVLGVSGLDSNWFYDDSSGQVFSRRASINGKRFSVDYVRVNYTANALKTAGSVSPNDQGARALTRVPVIAEVSDKVDQLTAGKTTEYDRVRAIYEYFRPVNGFTYSLTTDKGDSGNAIVDFLNAKRGFCVQYAAAMAWLVREAGYPARVAFGFTRGAGPRNGTYSLTNLNLHAWTEVYFQDFGWVPFDATPSSSILGSVSSAWAPDGNATATDDPSESAAPIGSAAPAPSAEGPDRGFDPGGPEGTPDAARGLSMWWIGGVALLAVLLVVLLLPSARRRALRRSRRTRAGQVIELGSAPPEGFLVTDPTAITTARRDAHSAWAELIDTMVDFGVLVDPSETPRGTAERLRTLSELGPPGRAQAGVIAAAEERARYARSPVQAERLDEAVRATRDAFRERASRTTRIQAALFPRSVLQRWRTGWIGFVSRNVRIAGIVRDALVTVSPRRLLTRSR
jgi:transglutaminase-like putative cysteine protease